MKRCPACNARYRGKETCHRCGMEIAPLVAVKTRANEHYNQALRHFYMENYDKMYTHARRANSLYQTPASLQMLACAAMMDHRFEQSIQLWRQYLRCQPLSSS